MTVDKTYKAYLQEILNAIIADKQLTTSHGEPLTALQAFRRMGEGLIVKVKPDTQTRYFPIMRMPAGSVIMTGALVSLQACQNDAYNGRHGSEKLAGALEVEFIPETLELVSAKIIKIENFPTL